MSFKQTKHWDSEVMRSLEKVAYEKGLVKPEPLQKQASVTKKADITPTPDLMQNIIKLCSGLRSEGLEKEAVEIETNFLNYKYAQTLYETSKEKGEDLVNAAHPQGSHKLEGLDSEEAVVEDIVDRHNKMKTVVDKKPTGKYASSQDILNAVKVTLGADPLAKERGNLSAKKSLHKQADIKDHPVISAITTALATYGGIALSRALKKIIADYALRGRIGAYGVAALDKAILGQLSAQATNALNAQIATQMATGSVSAAAGPAATAAVNTAIAAGPTAVATGAAAGVAGAGAGAGAAGTAGVAGAGVAAETAGVGAGVAAETAGAAGLFGTLAAAVVAAGAAGIVLGAIINSKLYDADFYSKDLKEAGDKVVAYAQQVDDNDIKVKAVQFKSAFSKILSSASVAKPVGDPQNVSPQDLASNLKAIGNYGSNLSIASNIALEIDKVIDDSSHWYSGFTSFFESKARHDLNASVEGFINLASSISEQVSDLHHKLLQKLKELKAAQSPGGSSELVRDFNEYAKQIVEWKTKATALQAAGKLPNADKVLDWLNRSGKEINDSYFKFKNEPNQLAVTKKYLDDFNQNIKAPLDAFKTHGLLK